MTDYGKIIGNALHAVRRMHSDASKLLQDCDGTIGKGRASIYGSYVTRGLTAHVRANHYMAEGLYRLYDATKDDPGLVEGVSIYFLDEKSGADEPVLFVGQIKYHVEQDAPIKNVSKEWDLWDSFFSWSDQQTFDEILTPCDPDESGRIEWVKVIAVPLYSVENMEVVVGLMDRVRHHEMAERH
jgi:hypothetical protein